MSGARPHHGPPENTALQHEPWSVRLRSKAGWADSATYTMADLTMIRKELVIGYVVAGFLATLVPVHVWNTCSCTATASGRRSRTSSSGRSSP